MNLVKIFAVAIFLFGYSTTANSQQLIKPKFKKMIYVDFYLDNSNKNQIFNITEYLEVNENGQAHFKSKYYSVSLDTTYKLPDTLIVSLNKVFDGNVKLKSLMIKDRYPEGTTF